MVADNIKTVVIVGRIIMYGTLFLSVYKNDELHCFIDVDYAPDGCAMVHDGTIEINNRQFLSLIKSIAQLLSMDIETDDEGCPDCYVKLTDENGTERTFAWPDELYSETFIAIGKQVNGIIQNDVTSDFLSMF